MFNGGGLLPQPFLARAGAGALRQRCREPAEKGVDAGAAVWALLRESKGRVHHDHAGAVETDIRA